MSRGKKEERHEKDENAGVKRVSEKECGFCGEDFLPPLLLSRTSSGTAHRYVFQHRYLDFLPERH